jgi:TRAP transporter TAXI family solute receptor
MVLGLGLAGLVLAGTASAQDIKFFRIGTGGTAGTYFPIGGLLANAISNPPGSRGCNEGGSCGVPGLVATAVASNGSVANINAIAGGSMESGFTQSDVAYWAYTGTGIYEGKPKVAGLRLIANLYPESIHLVARKGAGIKGVADLKGKRVSLDEPGSGTLVDARIIMSAFGITEKDIKAEYLKPNQAGDKLRDGGLDAFFFVGGYPAGAIAELSASGAGIELVPIAGPEIDKMRTQYGFFANDMIPANTYKGVNEVKTLAVGAQWVTSEKVDPNTVYEITKALWNANTRKLLDSGHAKGKAITRESAVAGAGIPFHPGAEKFYKEVGLLK